jgi:hypothetical protein
VRHREHLAALAPVVRQCAAVGGLGAVGLRQLLGRKEAELVEDAHTAHRQPLRRFHFDDARNQHPLGHEVDHLFQAALAYRGGFFQQQAIEQRERSQQHVRGCAVLYFEQEGAACTLAVRAFVAVGLEGEHIADQRGRSGLAHGYDSD